MRNFKISTAFAKEIRKTRQAVIEVARSAYFLRPKEFLSYETNGSFVQKEKKIVKISTTLAKGRNLLPFFLFCRY